jgi:penicillin-binding protein 2B
MKIYSFMAAIEEGLYDGNKKYDSGSIEVDGFKISDWNKIGWGSITYDTGFTYSSNVAAVHLAQALGKEKLLSYYEKFGFGSKTGIELPNEYSGKLDFIYASELANAGFGQGITTTPIQNIEALTSLTNGGVVLKPYIISKIVDPNTGKTIYEGKRTEVGRAVSETTVNKIIDLMDQTVNNTDSAVTGYKYHTDAVRLIGKTGTAQFTLANGKYSSGTYNNIRSFAGVFPKENPEYIIYFSVKEYLGDTTKLSNNIKSVVESIAKYRNLDQRVSDEDTTKIVKIANYINSNVADTTSLVTGQGLNVISIGDGTKVIKQYPIKNESVLKGSKVFLLTNYTNLFMPNMTGWTSSEAVSFANLINLKYNVNGYGIVTSTSIAAGSSIDLNSTLDINLGG